MYNQPQQQPPNQQGPQYYPPQGPQPNQGPQGPRFPQMGGGSGGRGCFSQWIILAVVAVLVVCGGLALLRTLGSSVASQPLPVPANPNTDTNPSDGTGSGQGGNPSTDTGGQSGSTTGPQLGSLVTASGIGQKNAPVNTTNTFASDAPVIYAVVEGISVPQGSTFFARWFRENQPFEDSPEITADKDYTNTYVEFHLQPQKAGALQPGNYGVQIFVNGNPGPSAAFTVR